MHEVEADHHDRPGDVLREPRAAQRGVDGRRCFSDVVGPATSGAGSTPDAATSGHGGQAFPGWRPADAMGRAGPHRLLLCQPRWPRKLPGGPGARATRQYRCFRLGKQASDTSPTTRAEVVQTSSGLYGGVVAAWLMFGRGGGRLVRCGLARRLALAKLGPPARGLPALVIQAITADGVLERSNVHIAASRRTTFPGLRPRSVGCWSRPHALFGAGGCRERGNLGVHVPRRVGHVFAVALGEFHTPISTTCRSRAATVAPYPQSRHCRGLEPAERNWRYCGTAGVTALEGADWVRRPAR